MPRRVAEGPLYGLVATAILFMGGLWLAAPASFSPWVISPIEVFEACHSVASAAAANLSFVGSMMPHGLLAVMVLAATLALVHQLWTTQRVLGRVLARAHKPDARVKAVAAAVGVGGAVDVVPDDAVYTFCYGFREPRVCISSGLVALLDDVELGAVLRHEAHHARHFEPIKILLGRTAASGLFFLPLAGALRNAYLARKELCADADAGLGRSGDVPLARALVKMLRAERPTWPAGVLAIGALTPTEARIRHLLEPDTAAPGMPSALDWLVSAALTAGIFGFTYGTSQAAPAVPPAHEACTTTAYLPPISLDAPR